MRQRPGAPPNTGCKGCPSEFDPCLWCGAGDNPAHIIVVSDNPSGFSIGRQEAFFGPTGRMFQKLLGMVKNYQNGRYANIRVYKTYAVLAGAVEVSAEHVRYCQPHLINELTRVRGVDSHAPIIVAIGATALKALGIRAGKITDVVGRELTTVLPFNGEARTLKVIPVFEMRTVNSTPGYTNVVLAALLRAAKLATGDAADTSIPLEILTKEYVFPQTVEEVGQLVDHVIGYFDTNKKIGPQNWLIGLDTETNTLHPETHKKPCVLMVSVAWDDGKAATILLDHEKTPYDPKEAWKHVERLLRCPKPKVFHNWKFDRKFLENVYKIPVNNLVWDTLCGEHYIDEDKKGLYGLKKLTTIYTPDYTGYDEELQTLLRGKEKEDAGLIARTPKEILSEDEAPEGRDQNQWERLRAVITQKTQEMEKEKNRRDKTIINQCNKEIAQLYKRLDLKPSQVSERKKKADGFEEIPLDTILRYAAIDADVTRMIAKSQLHRLSTTRTLDEGKSVMRQLYLPASNALGDMEFHGFKVDMTYLDTLDREVGTLLWECEKALQDRFGIMNYRSPTQIAQMLSKLSFEHIPGADGSSTGKDVLDRYVSYYPPGDARRDFAENLLAFRAADKAKSGFLKNLRKLAAADGRIHCNFNLTGTATGRLCVSGETVLDTSIGQVAIADLPESLLPHVWIETHRGRYRRILRKFFKGYETMFRVVTRSRKSIVCTHGHRFLTPDGWRHLYEIQKGEKVLTKKTCDLKISHCHIRGTYTSGAPDNTPRGCLCRVRHSPRTDARTTTRTPQPDGKRQHVERINGVLQGKIRRRTKTAQTRTLLACAEGQSAWTQGATRSALTQRKVANVVAAWVWDLRNRLHPGDVSLVCTGERALPQLENSNTSSVQDIRHRSGVSTTIRNAGSQHHVLCRGVLRQPTPLLPAAIPSICAHQRIYLVHQGIPKSAHVSRVGGATQPESAASSASCAYQKDNGRFLFPECEFGYRGRRGIPSERQRNTAPGQTPRSHITGGRISDTALYGRTSTPPATSSFGCYTADIIESIECVGIRGVWDIEVEEDHSYIAQDFINHNSSSSPNMQNIPPFMCRIVRKNEKGEEEVKHPGFNIKKLFIPSDDNHYIVNVDIKGAELRVYTAYSHDQKMIDALLGGLDIHSFTASKIYKLPYEVIEKDRHINKDLKKKRDIAKRVVFGTFYGAGAYKISEQINSTKEEAQRIIDLLFSEFPALKLYIDSTKERVRTTGFVQTHFGRFRRFKLAHVSREHMAESVREAVNFLIQSTASDLVLSQLCEISQHIGELGGKLLITVHDSMTFEIPKTAVNLETRNVNGKKKLFDTKGDLHNFFDNWIVKRVADKYDWLPVPFLYDIEIGPSYGELKEVSREN